MIGGLLGQSWDDPKTMGLLQLAAQLSSARKPMQGLTQGLLGYQQAIAQGRQQKSQEEERALRKQMAELQLQQAQQQAAQQRQANEFRASIPSPQELALSQALGSGARRIGPTPENAAAMPPVSPMQQQMHAAMRAGVLPVTDYLQSMQPKQAKIKEFQQVRMPDGSVQIVGFDEYGKPVDTGRTPYKDAVEMDLGGVKALRDPITGQVVNRFAKSNTPDALLSAQTTMRGQNMTDARARERLDFDRDNAGGVTYQTDGTGQIVALPKRPSVVGNITAIPVQGQGSQSKKDATEALALTSRIREILPNATGSMLGNGLDYALGAFGVSTEGADNASKLRALEGQLVAKMPKMSGPQSDKDAARYVQMAAEVGNANLPVARRMAALDEVEYFQRFYAGQGSLAAPPNKTNPAAALVFDPATGTFK